MTDSEFDNDGSDLDNLGSMHEIPRDRIWSVTDITLRVKTLIETEPMFSGASVRGEVTNVSASKAGHIYFGLKDQKSYLKCVAFRSSAERLRVKPTDGREVVARGRLNVWEAGGTYQLIVDSLEEMGLGELWLKFEETRKRLASEGLFNEEYKVPLPRFPRTIGLVTSQTGAALRDIIRVFSDRAPYARLILAPSLVQGATAPESLINAVNVLEMWHEVEQSNGNPGLDLMIIGRGGGSFEDLSCFNDENLARRIFELKIPVISAVGHEVDFTIIDFVADVRAATPTQAAQIAVTDVNELNSLITDLLNGARGAAVMRIESDHNGVANLLSRPVYTRPVDRINNLRLNLDTLSARSARAADQSVKMLKHKIQSLVSRLDSLDPGAILDRGYSLAFRSDDGSLVSKTGQAGPNERIDLRVSDGTIKLRVESEDEKS